MHSDGDFSLKMSLYHTLHSLWAVYGHFLHKRTSLSFSLEFLHFVVHAIPSQTPFPPTPLWQIQQVLGDCPHLPPSEPLQGHISVADELQECNWFCTLFIFPPIESLLRKAVFLTGMIGLIRVKQLNVSLIYSRI